MDKKRLRRVWGVAVAMGKGLWSASPADMAQAEAYTRDFLAPVYADLSGVVLDLARSQDLTAEVRLELSAVERALRAVQYDADRAHAVSLAIV